MPSKRVKGKRMPLIAVRMPDHMVEALRAEATRSGLSQSDVVRVAVARLLDLDPWATDGPARSGAA